MQTKCSCQENLIHVSFSLYRSVMIHAVMPVHVNLLKMPNVLKESVARVHVSLKPMEQHAEVQMGSVT